MIRNLIYDGVLGPMEKIRNIKRISQFLKKTRGSALLLQQAKVQRLWRNSQILQWHLSPQQKLHVVSL